MWDLTHSKSWTYLGKVLSIFFLHYSCYFAFCIIALYKNHSQYVSCTLCVSPPKLFYLQFSLLKTWVSLTWFIILSTTNWSCHISIAVENRIGIWAQWLTTSLPPLQAYYRAGQAALKDLHGSNGKVYAVSGIFLCGETKELRQILEESTMKPYADPEG